MDEGIRTRRWYKENGLTETLNPIKSNLKEDQTNWPFAKFYGSISYCTTLIDIAIASNSLLEIADKNEELLLGFDMEWPFSFQTGPGKTALIQICPDKRTCYLFHVSELKSLPAALVGLLSHDRVKLCGVNIRNDIHKLCRDFPVKDKEKILLNCIDSRNQANQVSDLRSWSMEKLVNYFLKMKIDKSSPVRKSKWHIIPLTEEQQVYAAVDAYISLVLNKHISSLIRKQELLNSADIEEVQLIDRKD